MTRRVARVLGAIAMIVVALTTASRPSAAGDTPPSSVVVTAPHIIPRPNSGQAPKYATDPGGWGQYALIAGIIGAIGLIFVLVLLESRRKRSAQGRLSTRKEPVADSSENPPSSTARQ